MRRADMLAQLAAAGDVSIDDANRALHVLLCHNVRLAKIAGNDWTVSTRAVFEPAVVRRALELADEHYTSTEARARAQRGFRLYVLRDVAGEQKKVG